MFEFFIAICHILVYISRWENKMDENNILRLKWYIENYTKDIAKAEIKWVTTTHFEIKRQHKQDRDLSISKNKARILGQ